MGIINATPDSFFEGSRVNQNLCAEVAGKMLDDGADVLDIGGQSTRPGAIAIGSTEEADRVLPVVEIIRSCFPDSRISVDTWYADVARQAIAAGAGIINDISAGDDDPDMLPLIASAGVSYIAMHKQGTPETMQINPSYNDVLNDVLTYFRQKKQQLADLGIRDWILDPGFGFGKTTEHNFQILANLNVFQELEQPVLVGISRKGMIWRTLKTSAEQALNGTTALHMAALMNGAAWLRVHDVKEARECIQLYQMLAG